MNRSFLQGNITLKRYLARALLAIITTGVVLGHVIGLYTIPYIHQIEDILYDTRVRLSAPGGVDDRIVIVAIDEASLQEHGHWPFTREKFAAMMENLVDYGAAVVGFDVLFAERDESSDVNLLRALAEKEGDAAFAEKLSRFEPLLDRDRLFANALQALPTVLGYYFDSNPDTAFVAGVLPYPAFDFHESMVDSIFLPRGEGYTSNLPVLMDAVYGAGFINNPLIDNDGVVRRTPLLHEYQFGAYEALSLAVAATYLNDITLPIFVDASRWMGDYPPLEGLEIAGRPIPIDPQGAVLVPYRGPAGSFPYVSIGDVISGRVEDPSVFEGRIALIGATAPGMEDLRTTPFGSIYPGVEVHANVIAGVLDGNFRWEPAYTAAAEMITVAAFGFLTALLLPLLSPIAASVVTVVITAGALVVNWYMWNVELHVLPLAMTLYTLFAIYTINMLFGYLFETRSRLHMDSLFGQYVPPDLVKEMSRDPENYSLASQKRELSVLFTDIRSFTTISEGLEADELSELMDEYLTPMTRIVHETQGTIDKYIGDAVMAFWGAPVFNPQHADQAVGAGMDMLTALQELNEDFAKKGWPEIRIGVGVNTGMMSVGNMGSAFRRAYTVLGDAVNLGSRLEGITKAYGVDFIVSETTAQQAGRFVYRELDKVQVKGKAKPVTILEPVGLADELGRKAMDNIRAFHHFLFLYRNQDWVAALKALRQLRQKQGDCLLFNLYQERIDHFQDNPPGEDWDGVFVHTS
ncbi:MAG: adenylate/guanylate cyclase domain-containing protein, partial [Xanthomonadales bacterium]|nr:adenylate/guanylate cyclase domain-containing protein [Xanthomonadales bacterium]